jgi:nitroimidazol reductase NimA-like FMN-containing flavoprotein (pyridoxamine 5'-phosphate oxidase superfamily)
MAQPASRRTKVKRIPDRGIYDRATIYAILDEVLVCHLGFVHDEHPYVIPTLFARVGDEVYVHGSAASRMLRSLRDGVDACLTATLVDGIVLARSIFHHSINYRSVVVLGRAVEVREADEKLRALEAFSARLVPGRWAEVRPPTPLELKATQVLRLPLDEASAKVRSGPPLDEEEDYALPVWAGVLPIRLATDAPEPDSRVLPGLAPPAWAPTRDRI